MCKCIQSVSFPVCSVSLLARIRSQEVKRKKKNTTKKQKKSPEILNAAPVTLDQDLKYQADRQAGTLQGPRSDN